MSTRRLLEGGEEDQRVLGSQRRRRLSHRLHALFGFLLVKAPAASRETESLDYEPMFNRQYMERMRIMKGGRRRGLFGYSGLTLAKNVVILSTGLLTGLVCVVMTTGVGLLLDFRNNTMFRLLHLDMDHDGDRNYLKPFLFNIVYGLMTTAVGAFMVSYWAPTAAGAGVTLVIAYLNGNHVPNLFSLKTLITKVVGAIGGVASGLAIGPEGPMVHIGACIASNITYANCAQNVLLSKIWPWNQCLGARVADDLDAETDVSAVQNVREGGGVCKVWEELHDDSEHREFIAAGASSGLSAAFGAPIGSVLFSMEEACSFWSRKVAWRCFMCSVLAAFVISEMSKHAGEGGVISFKRSDGSDGKQSPASSWLIQVPFISLVAAMGGVLGAMFNMLRRFLWRFRASRSRKRLRIVEALAVNFFCVCIVYVMVTYYGRCQATPSEWAEKKEGDTVIAEGFAGRQWNCPHNHHNDLATQFWTGPDELLGRLFSVSSSDLEKVGFTRLSLAIYGTVYLVMMALGAGICVPAGLFMPSISLGASFGLLAGIYVKELVEWLPPNDWIKPEYIQPGLYALVCSTAVLAGVFRSAISLVVLVVEGTRGISFLFGIIIAVLVANAVANLFEHDGVYESELERDEAVPFLRHDPPHQLAVQTAADVMTERPFCLPVVVPVREVVQVLQQCSHHGFPVLRGDQHVSRGGSQLEGLVLRSQLMVLLSEGVFCDEAGQPIRSTHATSAFQLRVDRQMRLFYRKRYTHFRNAAVRDPVMNFPEAAMAVMSGADVENAASRIEGVGVSDASDLAYGAEASMGNTKYINLRPYMNTAPLALRQEMPATRVHRTFVTLGLRHLCVVDEVNNVMGIITRKDLREAAEHPKHHGRLARHNSNGYDGQEPVLPMRPALAGSARASPEITGAKGSAGLNGSAVAPGVNGQARADARALVSTETRQGVLCYGNGSWQAPDAAGARTVAAEPDLLLLGDDGGAPGGMDDGGPLLVSSAYAFDEHMSRLLGQQVKYPPAHEPDLLARPLPPPPGSSQPQAPSSSAAAPTGEGGAAPPARDSTSRAADSSQDKDEGAD